jgi:hypothetical protein
MITWNSGLGKQSHGMCWNGQPRDLCDLGRPILKDVYAFLDACSFAHLAQTCSFLYDTSYLSPCFDIISVDSQTAFDDRWIHVRVRIDPEDASPVVQQRPRSDGSISSTSTVPSYVLLLQRWSDRVIEIVFERSAQSVASKITELRALSVIPPSTRKLILPDTFNDTLVLGFLPFHLTHLSCGNSFNQWIAPGVLPPGLTHLDLGDKFSQPIVADIIPSSVRVLLFGRGFIHGSASTGERINCERAGVSTLHSVVASHPCWLPRQLEMLKLYRLRGTDFDHGMFGHKLTCLSLGILQHSDGHAQMDLSVLPYSLTHLTFLSNFNQRLSPFCLPPFLMYLHLGDHFNQTLEVDVLPSTLEELIFGKRFDHRIRRGVLPDGLKKITFGEQFSHRVKPGRIPASVTHLTFGRGYHWPLTLQILPDFLEHLRVHHLSCLNNITHDNLAWMNCQETSESGLCEEPSSDGTVTVKNPYSRKAVFECEWDDDLGCYVPFYSCSETLDGQLVS